jgi:hypothetical protein
MTVERRDLQPDEMTARLRAYLGDGPSATSPAARQRIRSAVAETPQRRDRVAHLVRAHRPLGLLAFSAAVAIVITVAAVWSLFTLTAKVAAPLPPILPVTLPADSSAVLPSPSHPAIVLSAPLSGRVYGSIAVDGEPWIVKRSGGQIVLQHLDRTTLAASTTTTVSTSSTATGAQLVAAGDSLWIAVEGQPLTRVDPRSGVATGTSTVVNGPMSGAGRAIWFGHGTSVTRLDSSTGAAVAELPVSGTVAALAADDEHVCAILDDGELVRIDARTNELVGRSALPAGFRGLHQGQMVLVGPTAWVIDPTQSRIIGFDAASGAAIAALPVPIGHVVQLRAGSGAVWALMDEFAIARIDPASAVVTHDLVLGGMAVDVTDAGSELAIITGGAIETVVVP